MSKFGILYFIAVLFVLRWLLAYARRREWRLRLDDLGRELDAYRNGPELVGTHNGRSFRCHLKMNWVRRELTLSLSCATPFSFGAMRLYDPKQESVFYRFIPLCQSIRTGREDFDSKIILRSSQEDLTASLFKDPAVREAFFALMKSGFDELVCGGKEISVKTRLSDPEKFLDKGKLQKSLGELGRIAAYAEKRATDVADRQSEIERSLPTVSRLLFWLPIALFPACAALMVISISYPPLEGSKLANQAFLLSILFSIGYFLVWSKLIRGEIIQITQVIGFALALLVAFPTLFSCSAVVVNGYFDTSPTTEHRVVILSMKDGDDTGRMAVVSSWRNEGQTECVRAPKRNEEEMIIPNKTRLIVGTKPGRLAYEWVDYCIFEKGEEKQ